MITILATIFLTLAQGDDSVANVLDGTRVRDSYTITNGENRVICRLSPDAVVAGQAYVLSCEIMPTAEIRGRVLPDHQNGLGCGLVFHDKAYDKSLTMACRGRGPVGSWRRITSLPVTVPEWANVRSLSVGMLYCKGAGMVRNMSLRKAYLELSVRVKSSVPIRQVVVVDDEGRWVLDTGHLAGDACTLTRTLRAVESHGYTVYAVNEDGEVACSSRDCR